MNLRSLRSIIGLPVQDFSDGSLLGLIRDVILDIPHRMIAGFWVKPLHLPISNAVLQVSDIADFKQSCFVRGDDVFASPGDIVKMQEHIHSELQILFQPVYNLQGVYFGKVTDFAFDLKTFEIRQIFVQKVFLFVFPYQSRIIGMQRVKKITPEAVIIDDRVDLAEPVIQFALSKEV